MQFTTIAISSVIAFLATSIVADDCRKDVRYCGSSLENRGNYGPQISQALRDHGRAFEEADNTLFFCPGLQDGVIDWVQFCTGGCKDNGAKSDECK